VAETSCHPHVPRGSHLLPPLQSLLCPCLFLSPASAAGDLPRTVASLFKHITSKPIFKPGNFLSAARSKAVRCTLKGNDGLLYPLEKSLLFVHKPATWLRYSDIESLEFRRSTGSSRSWELAVHVKSGTAAAGISAGELALQALDKGEWEPLRAYFSERGVRVTEAAHGGGDIRDAMAGGEEEDEEDEDEEADGEVGRKRKRRAAAAGAGAGAGDEEEDSDEDDESYHGEGGSDDDDEDADAGSGSDDDDDAAGSEDEDEGFSKKKQPKKPAAKKAPAKKGKAASSKKGDEGGKGSKKAPAKKKPAKKRARRDSEDDDEDGGDSDE
jgi:structure-specific recognition protein 1